ncbi:MULTISPECIES: hypothetical protein [Chromobacterium]|uniref:hypothetical protein n=1 Tax=Chromobacterium TaxID=535 RepID=UPI0018878898|nr:MULTISPECIES: hypothetical protein [Chromobacterium]WON82826.1 hypothetical protein OK026_16955 [Chromobacterium haemolyticum]
MTINQEILATITLGSCSFVGVLILFFYCRDKWRNPFFLYVTGSLMVFLSYEWGGAEFVNGRSMEAEGFYLFSLLISCFGYRLTCFQHASLSVSIDPIKARKESWTESWLMGLMLIVLGILIVRLTSGNIFRLFDLSYGNELKWLRITEKDLVIYVSEATFIALFGVVLPIAVLKLARTPSSWRSLTLVILPYLLYLMTTGSRSPVVAAVLTALPAFIALREYGYSTRKIKKLLILLFLCSVAYFSIISMSRDTIDDNGNDALKVIFNANELGYLADADFLPRVIQLPLNVISIYFSSTFNNYVIIFQKSEELANSFGYRIFYSEAKFFSTIVPLMDFTNSEQVLSENTALLRQVSPTGDQWGTNLGTLILEFGLYGALFCSFIQGAVMGSLISFSRRLNSTGKVLMDCFLVPIAISSIIVHPLLSLSVHVQFLVLILILRKVKNFVQRKYLRWYSVFIYMIR